MKRLGSPKWLLVLVASVLLLSLGAVACGGDSDDSAGTTVEQRSAGRMQAQAERPNTPSPRMQAPDERRVEAAQERRAARAERQEALLDNLRDKMTEEDQALFDELKAAVEEQRGALDRDRQELADTLKELRALTDKYLGLDGEQDDQ